MRDAYTAMVTLCQMLKLHHAARNMRYLKSRSRWRYWTSN